MSIHLVIVDALNLIRRVHSAQPDSEDIERTINTTSRTLNRILSETQASHIIAIFDDVKQNRGWRAEILSSYKQNRKPMPQTLMEGLDSIQQAWWKLGVDSLLSDGDEADDLIATLATKMASRGDKVTIISTDQGYCQLLSPTLNIRDYFQHRWLDTVFIQDHFGVKPEQLTDYWGLVGISSSQIPGIPNIGPKSAREILHQFESIEVAYNAADLNEKYRKKFDAHIESARACKQVSTLKTDSKLGFNLQDIRYQTR